jgi:hypothetical protein
MTLSSCACTRHGHHGLFIITTNGYMPLSSSSYDIGHYHGFLINVISNYTPLPFFLSWWTCGLVHCHGLLIVATIAFPILMILWFVAANSCPPSPSWFYHLVIVVAMVIMVFSLLQPIAAHYCPHHFMVLIIVMVFLVLINVASNYTPNCFHCHNKLLPPSPFSSWWSHGLFIIVVFSLLQIIIHHRLLDLDDLVVLFDVMVFLLL